MKVISGKYKGIKLDGHDILGTRPTMDRVKESLMATIQTKISDSVCLDLFAGSGNVGIELLSNGSSYCYFVDNNYKAINTIKKNINKLNIKECTIYNCDYKEALKRISEKLDIIFLDPPYELNLINDCLNKIYELDLLNDGGIIICEYEREKVETNLFELIKMKKYGSKYINIYKKIKG